jgi:quercetin dioxygenase-like cupin family protein
MGLRIILTTILLTSCASAPALAQGYPAKPVLMTSETVMGETIVYPPGKAIVNSAIITLAPGERTIAHRHGAPFFAYILEGEITVDYGDRGKRTYRQGEALMEAMSVEHVGMNTGAAPVRLLGVYMGAAGVDNVAIGR